MKSKALFLDRDGVINFKAQEHDYVKSVGDLRLVPDIKASVDYALAKDYLIIVITNQRGVARGIFSEQDLQAIHTEITKTVNISAFYYCIHHLDACECRKPKPGMILQAAKDLNIDLSKSHLIGDTQTDIEAGLAARITSNHLVTSDSSILALVKKIL